MQLLAKNKTPRRVVVAAVLFLGVPALIVSVVWSTFVSEARFPKQVGNLNDAYQQWAAEHERQGGDKNIQINIGWVKGLSTQASRATGIINLNLLDGKATAKFTGLSKNDTPLAVWLVHNQAGSGRTVMPEPGDHFVRLGKIEVHGESAVLTAHIAPEQLRGFEIDLVMAAPANLDPSQGGMLFGAPTLFQRLYTRARTNMPIENDQPQLARLMAATGAGNAEATVNTALLDPLVKTGLKLFFNEKFGGNGRTCGTCHRAEDNFTISPRFIATLPANDPLFVAEFNPALAQNFEKPELMRKLGLILENTDGFGDLANKFTMRSVPHTLAMHTSLTPPPGGIDGTTNPPAQRTGWSGDGAPGNGTLREFAIGAVTQHLTKTLGRVAGADFRLPTDAELDAMEAFQLALGRQTDLDLSTLQLKGKIAARGLEIFQATDTVGGTVAAGKCATCHSNGGANLTGLATNFNFDTGVEAQPDKPQNLIAGALPTDGGFGSSAHPTVTGAFGNGTFNTPPVVEAADTGPFFHNNSVGTIEEAVAFYNSKAFLDSPAGAFLAASDSGGVATNMETTQVEAVAMFLRVVNALENIRSAVEYGDTTIVARADSTTTTFLKMMRGDTQDAIEVLDSIGAHPEAVAKLRSADSAIASAQSRNTCFFVFCSTFSRDSSIRSAITSLQSAQGDLKN